MATLIAPQKIGTMDTFEVKGEKFVVFKKEYLDELFTLMRSFTAGEKILREGKTRSFADFLKSIPKHKKR